MTSDSPPYHVPQGRVGVMLNANAGRVRRSTVRAIRAACPDATIFWTRSFEEAVDAVEAAIESGIGTLFAGGGDGTIIDLANRLIEYENTPQLGILKLGTGNALASWVGSRPIPEDLQAWSDGEAYHRRGLRFVRDAETHFPFGGMGWDAAILNDYKWIKAHLDGTPFAAKVYHLPAYLAAAFGRTAPRLAMERSPPMVTIEVLRGEAWRVDRAGIRIGQVRSVGEVLYSGPAHITAFGSTPFYGYAMRMLPHAELLDTHFTIRVSVLSIPQTINNLPGIWTGEYEDDSLYDFVAESVYVRYSTEVPYQVGGDAAGMRRDLVLELSPRRLPVVCFQ